MAKTPLEIASLARMHTRKAVKTLAAIMNEPSAPYPSRVAAAEALLDRGWGKPIAIASGRDNAPLRDRDSRADGQCDMGSGGAGTARAAREGAVMVAEPKARVAWSPRGNLAQMRLLKCQVFEIFFGGARGGGKTDGVLGEFGAHASRYGKDAIGLMVRRTRAELVETIERSREIYGPLGWKLNETEKMWRAPDGARLRFAYLERDADADMYQ